MRLSVRFEVIGQVRANGRRGEIKLRPELAVRFLQPEAERVAVLPIHQQQIAAAIAIHIHDLDGFDGPGKWNLDRFVKRVVGLLRQEINVVFRQQHQVGAAIAIQIARAERIGGELAVLDRPAFGRAPAVGALVVKHHQFLGLAVIRNVGPSVPVEVGHHEGGDALFRGDGINAEPGVGRHSLSSRLSADLGGPSNWSCRSGCKGG